MNHNLVTGQVEPNSFCSNPKRKILIYGSIGIVLIAIIVTIVVCVSLKGSDKNENINIESDNGTGGGNPPDSSNVPSDDEDDSFIEKEQPESDEETKKSTASYQKNPNEENFTNLRKAAISNYNKVLVKKENKSNESKEQTKGKPGGEEKVQETEETAQDMYITYWNRINSNMLRFIDTRLLRWRISEASKYEYIPVMGAGETVYIKRIPVMNSEYAQFIKETGYEKPSNWINGIYTEGEDEYPVNYVSYLDALKYCEWLNNKDNQNKYRIPSETEWELAAGHMPKDADFNNNIVDSRVSVYKYDNITRGAHGAIDFWGNVWEWTSTINSDTDNNMLSVKGGSWKSNRTDCRTENRKESRNKNQAYGDVGFRIIKLLGGNEPEKEVNLYTLSSPELTAKINSNNDFITLSWEAVTNAVEYQIFGYNSETNLFNMVNSTDKTTYQIEYSENNKNLKYVVQAISYREISDNIYPKYCVKPSL